MSSVNNVNNNNYVVNVGRTTPVSPGAQPASKSIPVVVSTDQEAVPVVEQNKILSEVSLSLLGIPRAEVALGIFADVNTYDVNPSEWSTSPEQFQSVAVEERDEYTNIGGKQNFGTSHLPEESGALVEAPADEVAVLTSKRFFRYQPGRVSAATFGIKNSVAAGALSASRTAVRNPTIKKYGIFDKYDGYYWESRDTGEKDQFAVVRRTQSIIRFNPLAFGNQAGEQLDDHALAGKPPAVKTVESNYFTTARNYITKNRFTLVSTAFTNAVALGGAIATYLNGLSVADKAKCERDMDLAIDAYLDDLKWGGDAHSIVNATTYRTAQLNNVAGEQAVHTELRDEIVAQLTTLGETAAVTKITTLSAYTISAVGQVQPTSSVISNANYGERNKIETIFSVYRKYLAYLVSVSEVYDTSITDENTLRYKCLRDVKFAVDAYANDLRFGGNSSTIYNAKRYYFNGELAVYTQTTGGVVAEIARHEYLKKLIVGDSSLVDTTQVQVVVNEAGTGTFIKSVFSLFGLENLATSFNSLSNIVINNFTTEYQGAIDFGQGPVFGDLVILRDGLLMTHAALYDPSLLKAREKQVAKVDTLANTLTVEKGDLIIGQYINYYGDAAGLVNGKTYQILSVSGHKSNVITLRDPMTTVTTAVDITSAGTTNQIETPVPFIFPDVYETAFTDIDAAPRYDGMFPYLYTDTGILPAEAGGEGTTNVGYIDTAINTDTTPALLKSQIDALNLQYVGWVRDHVDPQFWSVYEYRVPRSRFSGDSLDAQTRNAVYSDNVSGNRSGEPFSVNDEQVVQSSVWDFDFGKVTMLKIEFSWYGAVGALFLAYVPVGNGEARWVRVHHLRCSNQLKISSLGNATLPITYLVYGGGSENRLGIANSSRLNRGYDSSYSENLVKYGASYYIDGGDRGTVRLYNHSSDNPSAGEIEGNKYTFDVDDTTNVPGTTTKTMQSTTNPYFIVTNTNGGPAISTFYIGAKILTGFAQDQNIEVIWVDAGNNIVYINKPTEITDTISIIVKRRKLVYGLKTKPSIISGDGDEVRNRVQVYPTTLSFGATGTGSGKLSLLKTPIFQTGTSTPGSFAVSADCVITNSNLLTTTNNGYLSNDGDFTYGYFQGYINESNSFVKVLGKLELLNEKYYFYPLEVFNGTLTIRSGSLFLKEGIFTHTGDVVPTTINDFSKERLSSVLISEVVQSPIPGTGTELATYYVSAGSQNHSLSTYFDYNKEYISFPLTDNIETLYVSLESQEANTGSVILSVAASLTWEEQ